MKMKKILAGILSAAMAVTSLGALSLPAGAFTAPTYVVPTVDQLSAKIVSQANATGSWAGYWDATSTNFTSFGTEITCAANISDVNVFSSNSDNVNLFGVQIYSAASGMQSVHYVISKVTLDSDDTNIMSTATEGDVSCSSGNLSENVNIWDKISAHSTDIFNATTIHISVAVISAAARPTAPTLEAPVDITSKVTINNAAGQWANIVEIPVSALNLCNYTTTSAIRFTYSDTIANNTTLMQLYYQNSSDWSGGSGLPMDATAAKTCQVLIKDIIDFTEDAARGNATLANFPTGLGNDKLMFQKFCSDTLTITKVELIETGAALTYPGTKLACTFNDWGSGSNWQGVESLSIPGISMWNTTGNQAADLLDSLSVSFPVNGIVANNLDLDPSKVHFQLVVQTNSNNGDGGLWSTTDLTYSAGTVSGSIPDFDSLIAGHNGSINIAICAYVNSGDSATKVDVYHGTVNVETTGVEPTYNYNYDVTIIPDPDPNTTITEKVVDIEPFVLNAKDDANKLKQIPLSDLGTPEELANVTKIIVTLESNFSSAGWTGGGGAIGIDSTSSDADDKGWLQADFEVTGDTNTWTFSFDKGTINAAKEDAILQIGFWWGSVDTATVSKITMISEVAGASDEGSKPADTAPEDTTPADETAPAGDSGAAGENTDNNPSTGVEMNFAALVIAAVAASCAVAAAKKKSAK